MPFVVHPVSVLPIDHFYAGPSMFNDLLDRCATPEERATVTAWDTREAAYRQAETIRADAAQPAVTVSYVSTHDERERWIQREQNRFRRGEYVEVPWAEYLEHTDVTIQHFAHMSVDAHGMIAYTPDAEYGHMDRQRRIKPGRYLTEFYPSLSADDVQRYAHACTAYRATYAVTETADEAEAVYRARGPRTCMDWEHTFDVHPCRVYSAPGDLRVAYFPASGLAIGHIQQRVVVWPAKKRYGRVYGSGPLVSMLEADGYTHQLPHGARVPAIFQYDAYVMPYVDGIGQCSLRGAFFELDDEGPYDCQTQSGVMSEPTPERECERCGSTYADNDESYCESCEESRVICDDCGESCWDDYVALDSGVYCDHCEQDHRTECAARHCTESWHEEHEFSLQERRARQAEGTTGLCRECADSMVFCSTCGEYYSTEDDTCPDCATTTEAPDEAPANV